jgi:hypothetical protein
MIGPTDLFHPSAAPHFRRRMEKISWTDHVRNEEVFLITVLC